MMFLERCEQRSLDCCRKLAGCLFPSCAKIAGGGQLPNEAPAPMANGFTRAKIGIFAEPPSKVVGLADVDDLRAIHPVCDQYRLRGGRVFALEPSSRALRCEANRPGGVVDYDIDAAGRGAGVLGTHLIEGKPSNEACLLKFGSDKSQSPHSPDDIEDVAAMMASSTQIEHMLDDQSGLRYSTRVGQVEGLPLGCRVERERQYPRCRLAVSTDDAQPPLGIVEPGVESGMAGLAARIDRQRLPVILRM